MSSNPPGLLISYKHTEAALDLQSYEKKHRLRGVYVLWQTESDFFLLSIPI